MGLIAAADLNDLVRFGNHAVSAGELAAGVSPYARSPFTNLAGVPTDPTSVLLSLLEPDGTLETFAWPTQGSATGMLTKDASGNGRFYVDVQMNHPGRWTWNITGVGTVQASSGDGELWVKNSVFT